MANFFLTDGLGSVLGVFSTTASSAALLSTQLFTPYGTQLVANGNSIGLYTAKGFTGQYADAVSGLDYYVSRYYDPVAGVFLSADKATGNVQGMNPYDYVGNNPETTNDPTGQYYSNGTSTQQHGGATAYVSGNVITTVTNDGYGTYWSLSGQETWNPYGGLSIDSSTTQQITTYGGYNPNTDARNSPWQKFLGVTGWTQLQQSWNAPGATTWDRLKAIGNFALTNANNLLQLAAIFGGPEDEVAVVTEDTIVEEGTSIAADVGKAVEEGAPCSFTPTTPVETNHGEQAIGTLKIGEQVLAYNPKTHKMEYQPILHVWINHDNNLVDLTLTTKTRAQHGKASPDGYSETSEVVHTNQKHPFFTKEHGFLPVAQLKLGMHILQADGSYGIVTGYRLVPGIAVMYNLEVAQDHTFMVGIGQWVVHNDCEQTLSDLTAQGYKYTQHFVDTLTERAKGLTADDITNILQNGKQVYDTWESNLIAVGNVSGKGLFRIVYDSGDSTLISIAGRANGAANILKNTSRYVIPWTVIPNWTNPFLSP